MTSFGSVSFDSSKMSPATLEYMGQMAFRNNRLDSFLPFMVGRVYPPSSPTSALTRQIIRRCLHPRPHISRMGSLVLQGSTDGADVDQVYGGQSAQEVVSAQEARYSSQADGQYWLAFAVVSTSAVVQGSFMVTFAEGFGEYKVFFDVTCE